MYWGKITMELDIFRLKAYLIRTLAKEDKEIIQQKGTSGIQEEDLTLELNGKKSQMKTSK